jgi:uncharacterized heparinase superfamily protein
VSTFRSSVFGPGARLRSGLHYRPTQLIAWGLDRLARVGEKACPVPLHVVAAKAPGPRGPDRGVLADWGERDEVTALAPAWRPGLHGDPRNGRWQFQEQEALFDDTVDWRSEQRSLLWQFHLHYLDTPAALAASEPGGDWQPWLAELLDDHWRSCKPGQSVGWMPFPVAVRLQNLLRIQALLEARGGADPALDAALCRHTRASFHYLRWRRERHLAGNHLLKELCCLSAAARVWGSDRLAEALLDELRGQVEAQFLAGGGHEERSLRYHLDCLRDLAEARAALPSTPAWLDRTLDRGLGFAEALEHPDGDIPLFNDAELGMTHPRADLDRLLGRPLPTWTGVRTFVEEGFVAARIGDAHLAFDCGPVGADHQPAHAHCDVLSLELSHRGARVLGNRGTLAYGDGADRQISRTTASHSTLQFDDEEQVEIWGAFRVGWRGKPILEEARLDRDVLRVSGRYAWHPALRAEHRRSVELEPSGRLSVHDQVRWGRATHAVARFWLPGAERLSCAAAALHFRTAGQPWRLSVEGATLSVTESTWFPRQGHREPALLAEVRPAPGQTRFTTRIEPSPNEAMAPDPSQPRIDAACPIPRPSPLP